MLTHDPDMPGSRENMPPSHLASRGVALTARESGADWRVFSTSNMLTRDFVA